jgi:very-short-patch-repair endonuclease
VSQSIPRARHLRRNQTSAEAKLWRVLRNRALNGGTFRRQYPIDRFIVDFACVEARLVVEVDGATHSTGRELLYDAARAGIIEACGFALLRILNADLRQDPDGVRETPWAALPPRDGV